MDAMGAFVGEHMKRGTVVDTAGLQATDKGRRVRLDGGTVRVIDGPFTESKEVVGGYAILELPSATALELVREFIHLHRVHHPAFNGECEVRPVEAME